MRGAEPREYSLYFKVWRHSRRCRIGREVRVRQCLWLAQPVSVPSFGLTIRNHDAQSSACAAVEGAAAGQLDP
jgi:hypothetical protein